MGIGILYLTPCTRSHGILQKVHDLGDFDRCSYYSGASLFGTWTFFNYNKVIRSENSSSVRTLLLQDGRMQLPFFSSKSWRQKIRLLFPHFVTAKCPSKEHIIISQQSIAQCFSLNYYVCYMTFSMITQLPRAGRCDSHS